MRNHNEKERLTSSLTLELAFIALLRLAPPPKPPIEGAIPPRFIAIKYRRRKKSKTYKNEEKDQPLTWSRMHHSIRR
jgi:hypothetical protein